MLHRSQAMVGEIGMFRLRMNDITYEYEKSSDQKITYVADFCDRNFTVGYRDKVDSYPYTWDFTDIQGFSSSKMDAEADNYPIVAAANDAYGYEWNISLFDADGNMKVNTGWDPITNNLIFSPHKIGFGNQLWAGGDVIPETRGLWFYSEDDSETGYTSEYSSALYNDCLQITSDGIHFCNAPFTDSKTGKSRVAWWNYKMVVPDVPADGAVYLRMTRDDVVSDDDKTWSDIDNAYVPFVATRFQFASQSSKTQLSTDTEVKGNGDYAFYKVDGSDDEWILAVKNTGSTQHLTFTLNNGWVVKKVAVSTDPKTVNVKGYASESRDHAIDHALTSFLTGKDIKAYTVSSPDYVNRTLTLTNVGSAENHVLPANQGCVINAGESNLNVLDGGFHLFVPDMHDGEKAFNGDNLMVANVETEGLLLDMFDGEDDELTNYALTYKYQMLKEDGTPYGDVIEGDEMFYRVSNKGIKLHKNSAYLQLPTSEVKPSPSRPAGCPMFSFIFTELDEGETVITGIEEAGVLIEDEEANAVWYNLNGQKLNGKPSARGIYIRNGKKVFVK